jgi:hypothetical protein
MPRMAHTSGRGPVRCMLTIVGVLLPFLSVTTYQMRPDHHIRYMYIIL